MNRSNWFLVIPTIIFGVWASWALYQMHAAGDARRAVEIVGEYRAEGRVSLAEYLGRRGPVECTAEVVSSFYGTMDVICRVGGAPARDYVWRVDVLQHGFAPADEATRALMAEYQPSLFGERDAGKVPGSTAPVGSGAGGDSGASAGGGPSGAGAP